MFFRDFFGENYVRVSGFSSGFRLNIRSSEFSQETYTIILGRLSYENQMISVDIPNTFRKTFGSYSYAFSYFLRSFLLGIQTN